MEEMISRIKEFSSINKNIKQVIIFDQSIQDIEIIKLYNDFGLSREKLEKSMDNYRDVGVILELVKEDVDFSADWKYYMDKFILVEDKDSKFDNILSSKDQTRLLVLTNRRLLRVDMQKLNERISAINRDILVYNEPVPERRIEKKGFMNSLKKIFN